MGCVDCYNGCVDDKSTFDKCVQYTGADITELGICTGDTLKALDTAIVTKLLSITNGTSITLDSLNTGCTFFSGILGTQAKNVTNVIQALVTGECTIKTLVDALSTKVNTPYTFNAACLTGLSATPSVNDIIQATINLACQANTIANAIKADYVKSSQLNSLIATYIASQTTPGSNQYNARMVPGVIYPYTGSLSNFDSTGAGLANFNFSKVYICNGQNGTDDLRGRSAVGANYGVPGSTLAAAVDPAQPQNAGYTIPLKGVIGAYTNTLDIPNMPTHYHDIMDPGHYHNIVGLNKNGADGNNVIGSEAGTKTKATTTSYTGIVIQGAGGNQPHNNTQPSYGVIFITFIP